MCKALEPREEMEEEQKLPEITYLRIALVQIVLHPPLISGQFSPSVTTPVTRGRQQLEPDTRFTTPNTCCHATRVQPLVHPGHSKWHGRGANLPVSAPGAGRCRGSGDDAVERPRVYVCGLRR